MHYSALSLAGVLLSAGILGAQQPVPPQQPQPPAVPVLDPVRNPLDALLLQWEQRMRSVQSLDADCTRLTVDKSFGTKEQFKGSARYMKPNLAMLDMAQGRQAGRIREIHLHRHVSV